MTITDREPESPSMAPVRPVHIDDMRMALQDLFIDGDWSTALAQDAGYDGEASAEMINSNLIINLDNGQWFKITIDNVY